MFTRVIPILLGAIALPLQPIGPEGQLLKKQLIASSCLVFSYGGRLMLLQPTLVLIYNQCHTNAWHKRTASQVRGQRPNHPITTSDSWGVSDPVRATIPCEKEDMQVKGTMEGTA